MPQARPAPPSGAAPAPIGDTPSSAVCWWAAGRAARGSSVWAAIRIRHCGPGGSGRPACQAGLARPGRAGPVGSESFALVDLEAVRGVAGPPAHRTCAGAGRRGCASLHLCAHLSAAGACVSPTPRHSPTARAAASVGGAVVADSPGPPVSVSAPSAARSWPDAWVTTRCDGRSPPPESSQTPLLG